MCRGKNAKKEKMAVHYISNLVHQSRIRHSEENQQVYRVSMSGEMMKWVCLQVLLNGNDTDYAVAAWTFQTSKKDPN